jgi:hypothetical protein
MRKTLKYGGFILPLKVQLMIVMSFIITLKKSGIMER